jgi:predicted anti-sigma-YlaC factor YlaD
MSDFGGCEHSEQVSMWMSLALDGMLDGAEQARLDQHVAGCSACRLEWEAMQEVSALFALSPQVGPPLGFAVRVERRLAKNTQQRKRLFGGVAVLTSSLSLAGVTMAAALMIILGVMTWQWVGALPSVQQGTVALSQVAAGIGLVGKGASLFLRDLLLSYGPPFVLLLGIGLALLTGLWVWVFIKRPGRSQPNGYSKRNGYA